MWLCPASLLCALMLVAASPRLASLLLFPWLSNNAKQNKTEWEFACCASCNPWNDVTHP